MSRVRTSSAHQLLGACGLPIATLRNVALSYFTSRMPRRLRQLQDDLDKKRLVRFEEMLSMTQEKWSIALGAAFSFWLRPEVSL